MLQMFIAILTAGWYRPAGLRQCNIYTCWFSHTTTDVLVSQLQLSQAYLLVDATLAYMHAGQV